MPDSTMYVRTKGRRNGLTTALIDLAVANAKAGAHVQFWSDTRPMADVAFRTACYRLESTDNTQSAELSATGGIHYIRFGLVGGGIEFLSSDGQQGNGRYPTVDVSVYDEMNSVAGKVVRHHANVRD